MEYELIEAEDKEAFHKIVNERLQAGWTLYGSPCITAYFAAYPSGGYSRYTIFAQAMVKQDESLNVFVHGVASPE